MTEASDGDTTQFLDGQILIAMPGMQDSRFQRALVYMCAHSEDGAMGLILNKTTQDLVWEDLFQKLEIPLAGTAAPRPVHFGGPVETGRGFVLHSADYFAEQATLCVDQGTSMTATLDVLQAIAAGQGPNQAIVALGYAGWAPGQLENELQMNGWLHCAPDDDLLYGSDQKGKWDRALAKLGVDPRLLGAGGHA
ncbi:MAG: YqgE/AlgH family protein [Pseudomonadota bacterium]